MMSDEKSLLLEIRELAKENNSMLRKMRRASRWSTAFRLIYWAVIAGLGLGAYYALQPYLVSAVNMIDSGRSVINSSKASSNASK